MVSLDGPLTLVANKDRRGEAVVDLQLASSLDIVGDKKNTDIPRRAVPRPTVSVPKTTCTLMDVLIK